MNLPTGEVGAPSHKVALKVTRKSVNGGGSEGRRLLGDRRRLLYCPGDDESSLSSDLASSPSLTSQKVIG